MANRLNEEAHSNAMTAPAPAPVPVPVPPSVPLAVSVHLRAHLAGAHFRHAGRSSSPSLLSPSLAQPPDDSLSVEQWLNTYMQDRARFSSAILFSQLKSRELFDLSHLGGRSCPSALRVSVALDLLDLLINQITQQFPSIEFPLLLARLRDELIPSIFQPPISVPLLFDHVLSGSPSVPCGIDAYRQAHAFFTALPEQMAKNAIVQSQVEAISIPSQLYRLRVLQKRVIARIGQRWRGIFMAAMFQQWNTQAKQRVIKMKEQRQTNIVHGFVGKILRVEQKLVFVSWALQVLIGRLNGLVEKKKSAEQRVADMEKAAAEMERSIAELKASTATLDAANDVLLSEVVDLRSSTGLLDSQLSNSNHHQTQCLHILKALTGPFRQAIVHAGQQFSSLHSRSAHSLRSIFDMPANQTGQPVSVNGVNLVGLEAAVHKTLLNPSNRTAAPSLQSTRPTTPNRDRASEPASATPPPPANPLAALSAILDSSPSRETAASPRLSLVADIVASWLHLQLATRRRVADDSTDGLSYLDSPLNRQRLSAALARVQLLSSKPVNQPVLPSFPPPDRPQAKSARSSPTAGKRSISKAARPAAFSISPLDSGTFSTPFSVFHDLSDSDSSESVLAACVCLMLVDDQLTSCLSIKRPQRLAAADEQTIDRFREHAQPMAAAALEEPATVLQQAHRLTALGRLMGDAIKIENETAIKLLKQQAVYSEVSALLFRLSLKALATLAHKTQRERDLRAAGILESSLKNEPLSTAAGLVASMADALDGQPVSRTDLNEVDGVLSEYGKELYKIFAYYCGAAGGSVGSEPLTMGNGEFWRFVRDLKLKLPHAALIDVVFMRAAEAGNGQPNSAGKTGDKERESVAQLIDSMNAVDASPSPMSAADRQQYLEHHRQQQLVRLRFQQFLAAVVRLAIIKFPNEKFLARRLKQLVTAFILTPNAKAVKFTREQAEQQQQQQQQIQGLNTPQVEAIYKKYNTLIRSIFGVYARITPNYMVLTFNDLLAFVRDYELLHKNITVHEMRAIFGSVQADNAAEEEENNTNEEANSNNNTHTRELSYRQFLEFLTALSHFVIRNPYLALHDRLDRFISGTLKQKKLPVKTFRM